MSSIDIRQDHALNPEQAHAAIDEAARKLDQRFGMRSSWNGDRLDFSGSGVDGAIELLPGQVRVTATLGFLLSAMQGMVETEIRRVLSEKLRN
ncbi:MAG: polyhydroxyalkanoic acid system family protein [Pseudomonas sp.]